MVDGGNLEPGLGALGGLGGLGGLRYRDWNPKSLYRHLK